MTARSDERKQFLTDVLITAVEGGIGYWSYARNYQWDVPLGEASVEVAQLDEPEKGWIKVDLDVIAKGIRLSIADGYQPESYFAEFVKANRTNGEEGDYDASVADGILQFGIFGEQVYG